MFCHSLCYFWLTHQPLPGRLRHSTSYPHCSAFLSVRTNVSLPEALAGNLSHRDVLTKKDFSPQPAYSLRNFLIAIAGAALQQIQLQDSACVRYDLALAIFLWHALLVLPGLDRAGRLDNPASRDSMWETMGALHLQPGQSALWDIQDK